MKEPIIDPMKLLLRDHPDMFKTKREFEDNEKPNPIPIENVNKAYIDALFADIYKHIDDVKKQILDVLNRE